MEQQERRVVARLEPARVPGPSRPVWWANRGGQPPLLPEQTVRVRRAARRAREVYPGPIGEVLAGELYSYAEQGWRAPDHGLHERLIRELLGDGPH
ncbi:hypothetical protein [Pseudonocardia sp.]|jgi:hypothetical protein|uniref:hypothetical protein n=1 Tax=Pseudonocardia sp. TaxID=60912 RepID=UPI0031FDC7E1